MGNLYSSNLTENSVAHIWIDNPSSNPCTYSNPLAKQFATVEKPQPLSSSVDDALWMSFRDVLTPLVAKLNYTDFSILNITFSALLLVVIIATVIFPNTLKTINSEIAPLVILYLICYGILLKKYQTIDEQIRRVMTTNNLFDRFKNVGYDVAYKTEHTGFCKPKHAKPARVFVFRSVEASVVSSSCAVVNAGGIGSGAAADADAVDVEVGRAMREVDTPTAPPLPSEIQVVTIDSYKMASDKSKKEQEGLDFVDSFYADIYNKK
mmetsp:Transcript_44667/g.54066  ORF Transcript_44667/g.54066 Transcript_44667/m.54066 type:complete len:265 (-) Transcript_44667:10-804(-)